MFDVFFPWVNWQEVLSRYSVIRERGYCSEAVSPERQLANVHPGLPIPAVLALPVRARLKTPYSCLETGCRPRPAQNAKAQARVCACFILPWPLQAQHTHLCTVPEVWSSATWAERAPEHSPTPYDQRVYAFSDVNLDHTAGRRPNLRTARTTTLLAIRPMIQKANKSCGHQFKALANPHPSSDRTCTDNSLSLTSPISIKSTYFISSCILVFVSSCLLQHFTFSPVNLLQKAFFDARHVLVLETINMSLHLGCLLHQV